MIAACTNHLWQSTLFAIAVGLLTLVFRKERAQVRYWLWLSASVKFLVPFSLLMVLGSYLDRVPAAQKVATEIPATSFPIVQLSQPFPDTLPRVRPTAGAINWTPIAILGVWACGFLGVVLIRFRGWRRIRAAVRASTPIDIPSAVKIRSVPPESGRLLEPGVVGLFRPVLLLPADIQQRLAPAQFDSILAHELCHVRRRDNLTSAVHMVVEALFWFHPLIWWIGARLIEERERACDEDVLRSGTEPQVYVDGILNVCTSYLEAPLSSVSGVAGANLKRRVRAILTEGVPGGLNFRKKAALATAGMLALAAPILVGMVNARSARAQSQPGRGTAPQIIAQSAAQSVAVTRPAGAPDYLMALGSVSASTVTVKPRVDGQLMSVTFKEGDLVQAGQVLASIDASTYQFQLAQAEGQLARDEAQLAELMLTKKSLTPEPQLGAMAAQIEGSIRTDRAKLDNAKLQLTYTQVRAPITGVAGLRLVDPGNIVHAADATGLLIVTQLQPIAVLFDLPEDNLPQVLARLREGANVPVEVWNRSTTAKIATSRLTAVDNQIDQTTGTVRLKAMFDNKDGALFPTQFVNVRLFLGAQ